MECGEAVGEIRSAESVGHDVRNAESVRRYVPNAERVGNLSRLLRALGGVYGRAIDFIS